MKWTLLSNIHVRRASAAVLFGIWLAFGQVAHAQQAKTTGGSPLDTLMSTRIWADVPEAKDFVRAARPAPDSLTYQPVTGTDPERPKLRNETELKALASELESALAQNERHVRKTRQSSGGKAPAATSRTGPQESKSGG